jgi:hypothetical protein
MINRSAVTHARLMRESTDRVEGALRSKDPKEYLVAHRVLETPKAWELWEHEHTGLMRQVADYRMLRTQAAALRHAALRLIHGKALFDYLRTNQVRGAARMQIIHHFYPTRGYQSAIVAEHGSYLRKACSYLCASHVGTELVEDPTFRDPMQHYENLYAEYFDLYCGTLHPTGGVESASERSLLPLLKHQLNEWRWIVLNPQAGSSRAGQGFDFRRSSAELRRGPTVSPRSRDAA